MFNFIVKAARELWRNLTCTPDLVHVMLDLETLGTKPGCKILSIGAVVMTPQGLGREFYTAVKRESQNRYGLHEDADTVAWWAKQSPEARAAAFSNPSSVDISTALNAFRQFLLEVNLDPMSGERRQVAIWGNGAGFDQPILNGVAMALGYGPLWKFYNERCYRTLKNLYPEEEFTKPQLAHHSLEDAKAQAVHAVRILNRSEHGWR